MGVRCELCDEFLNIFQLSKLCVNCYKIRTIVKAYNSNVILKHLEDNFLIKSDLMDTEEDKISNETILKDINDRVIENVNKKVSFSDTKKICDDNHTMKNLNKNLLDDLKEKLKYHSNNMMDTIKENDEID